MPSSNWWQAWGVWVAILVSVGAGGIGFVYNDGQRDQQLHAIEVRLERDEREYRDEYSELAAQLQRAEETHRREVTTLLDNERDFETETNANLAAIDVKLKEIEINQQHIFAALNKIEGYVMSVQEELTNGSD